MNLILEKAYEILKDVEDDIIINLTNEQENQIKDLIELDNYDKKHELRILRNYLVLIASKNCKEDLSNFKENRIFITVVTGMIDNKLFKMGCEV